MTINSYLMRLANGAIIRDSEKVSINRSVTTLQTRLNHHFGAGIKKHFVFGSYSRGTILPRAMDSHSDVDYMVVFSDSQYKPQTYLNKLKTFVETYYGRSEIVQSNPTIVLKMNHIRFELVPAVEGYVSGLQIPAKANGYQAWMETDPTGFNQTLSSANQSNQNLINPLIRLVKYWNARNNYLFESYDLEQKIVRHSYWSSLFQLKDLFYNFMESLDFGWLAPQWKHDALKKNKQLIIEVKNLERKGYDSVAEEIIIKMLPAVSGLA